MEYVKSRWNWTNVKTIGNSMSNLTPPIDGQPSITELVEGSSPFPTLI
jgi:hypothetical protein